MSADLTSTTLLSAMQELSQQINHAQQTSAAVLEHLSVDTTELGQFHDAIAHTEDTLDQILESVHHSTTEIEQALSEAQASWTETDEEAQTAITALFDEVHHLNETLHQSQQEMQHTIAAFKQSITQITTQFETFQTTIDQSFEEIEHDLTEVHLTTLETGFEQFAEFAHTQSTDLSNQFGQIVDHLNTSFHSFSTEADELSRHLVDRGGQIIQDTEQCCTNELKHELETSIRELIEDTIGEFVQEVATSLVLMGIGTSVTSSISPELPALISAKKIAEATNAGLDLIGL